MNYETAKKRVIPALIEAGFTEDDALDIGVELFRHYQDGWNLDEKFFNFELSLMFISEEKKLHSYDKAITYVVKNPLALYKAAGFNIKAKPEHAIKHEDSPLPVFSGAANKPQIRSDAVPGTYIPTIETIAAYAFKVWQETGSLPCNHSAMYGLPDGSAPWRVLIDHVRREHDSTLSELVLKYHPEYHRIITTGQGKRPPSRSYANQMC